MNYIPAEEFLKQSEKVQNVLIDWWKPEIGEKIYSTGISFGEYFYLGDYKENGYEVLGLESKNKALTAKKVFIPLLQMHQLIKFIEDTTHSKIDMSFLFNSCDYHDGAVGYEFTFYRIYEGDVWGSGKYDTVKIKEIDKLKALWMLACKVAGEIE